MCLVVFRMNDLNGWPLNRGSAVLHFFYTSRASVQGRVYRLTNHKLILGLANRLQRNTKHELYFSVVRHQCKTHD